MKASKVKKEEKKKEDPFWLFSFKDTLANITASSAQICTADLEGSGDYQCIIADRNQKKIKIFAGTSLQREYRIAGVPTCVCTVYMSVDKSNPKYDRLLRQPVLAVAIGPYIYMYFQHKALYRFLTPDVAIHEAERETWELLSQNILSAEGAEEKLTRLIDSGVSASSRTLEFLLIDNEVERNAFVEKVRDLPLRQLDSITCMAVLYETEPDQSANGLLVFCTEYNFLYVLKNNGVEILFSVKLPSTGVQLLTAGCFNQEYRIIISCRDGRVYNLKNGVLSKSVIQPDSLPVCIARYNNNVVVATMNNTITYFNLKGKVQHTFSVSSPIMNMETIVEDVTGVAKALLVSSSDGMLRVYVGKFLQQESPLYGSTTALCYSRYGREDASLLIVLQDGSLQARLLHRKATFSKNQEFETLPPVEQETPIAIPPLSSVFTSQSKREVKYALDLYSTYQHDLALLKLTTFRAYWSMLHGGQPFTASEIVREAAHEEDEAPPSHTDDAPKSVLEQSHPSNASVNDKGVPIAASEEEEGNANMQVDPLLAMLSYTTVRMAGVVQGMGPVFRVKLTVENHHPQKLPLKDLFLFVHCDQKIYRVTRNTLYLPFLAPQLTYSVEFLVEVQEGEIKGDGVMVLAVQKGEDTADRVERPLGLVLVDIPETQSLEGLVD